MIPSPGARVRSCGGRDPPEPSHRHLRTSGHDENTHRGRRRMGCCGRRPTGTNGSRCSSGEAHDDSQRPVLRLIKGKDVLTEEDRPDSANGPGSSSPDDRSETFRSAGRGGVRQQTAGVDDGGHRRSGIGRDRRVRHPTIRTPGGERIRDRGSGLAVPAGGVQ